MNNFTAHFEDTTVDGLLHQIWDYLVSFKCINIASEGMTDDNGGENQMAGEPAIGNDQSEGDG